jgi:hypothetical protein
MCVADKETPTISDLRTDFLSQFTITIKIGIKVDIKKPIGHPFQKRSMFYVVSCSKVVI